jgi:hypothetical protein
MTGRTMKLFLSLAIGLCAIAVAPFLYNEYIVATKRDHDYHQQLAREEAKGAKTVDLINQNVHVESVRDDIETLVFDAQVHLRSMKRRWLVLPRRNEGASPADVLPSTYVHALASSEDVRFRISTLI